jgi:uncharacterized protein (DUF58 family)
VAARSWPAFEPDARAGIFSLEAEAHSLADRLPELLIEAMRISITVAHGIHGRRRAGPGETFWQFRQFQSSDAATLIDWRRSASSEHLFVREREWEAAHTIWLWPDLSPSMGFKSHLAQVTKRDRALVLTLAIAELLVRGGERIALLGLTRPSASRNATTKLAEAIAGSIGTPALEASLPPAERLGRFSGTILFSDFLEPVDSVAERLKFLASTGVSGHLVQVLDPAEESLPYAGRTEFIGLEGEARWIADRAESLRPAYLKALTAHRAGLEEVARRLGWSFLVHHTDRPAAEALLTMIMRLGSSGQDYRWTPASATARAGEAGAAP